MEEVYPLLQFLNKFVALSPAEFEQAVLPSVSLRAFDEKEVVTASGNVEDFFNFLLKGLARTYFVQNGAERVVQLATEGHIIHAQASFHSRQPSVYIIETPERSLFASITFADLEAIYASSPKMEKLGRLVITYTMLLKEKMQMQVVCLSPRERFLQFMEKYPGLQQRVPQKYLASYLNIKPETFSRFKHLLRNRAPEPGMDF